MNLRRTQHGGFAGTTLYKVRRKSTGLYFKPEYRNPKWEQGGRSYTSLNAARSAARSARERDNLGGTTSIPDHDLEVVEFHVVEAQTHQLV